MVDQGKHKLFEDLGPTANVSVSWIYFHTEYNYVLYVCTMSMRKIQNRNFRAFSASLQIAQQSKPKSCVWKQEDKYEWLREYFFHTPSPPAQFNDFDKRRHICSCHLADKVTARLPRLTDWLTDWLQPTECQQYLISIRKVLQMHFEWSAEKWLCQHFKLQKFLTKKNAYVDWYCLTSANQSNSSSEQRMTGHPKKPF